MEFLILGPLEVRSGPNTAVHLGSSKQRALLGALLLHANETVSTGRLVDAVWGEHAPATAEKLVQGYVHALRKQLGPDVLETRAPGYRIVVDRGSLDLFEFERLTASARAAPVLDGAGLYREALALWRGSPLSDVALEGADRHVVARLEELRLLAQLDLVDVELALGRHAALVGELEALAAAHPYQERVAAQLMLALYRSGRQAEALDVYRATRDQLDEELGLQPGKELRELEASILRQDPVLAAPEAPLPLAPAGGEPTQVPAVRGRRRLPLLGAVALLAVVVLAAIALALRDDAPFVAPPDSVVVIDAGSNRPQESIGVGVRPGPIAVGGGAVWVGNLDDRSLTKIDLESRAVLRNIPLPATPDAIAFGAGAVWVANGRLGTLYRVDPTLDAVTDALRLASRSTTFADAGVDVGGGSVWAAFGDSTLARVDPFPLREDGLGTAGGGPTGVVSAFGSIWVSNAGDATVLRFAPATFEAGPIGEFTVGRRPAGLAAGDGAIWVACADDDYVARLDATLGSESSRTVPVGDGPTAVAVAGGAVWVANTAGGTVSRIDPESNDVVETIEVGNSPAGIAVAEGTVWATVQAP